jgi:hypothetical protein
MGYLHYTPATEEETLTKMAGLAGITRHVAKGLKINNGLDDIARQAAKDLKTTDATGVARQAAKGLKINNGLDDIARQAAKGLKINNGLDDIARQAARGLKITGATAMARRAAKEALKYNRPVGAKKILDSSINVLKSKPTSLSGVPIVNKLRLHKAVTPLVDDAGVFLGREAQRQQDNLMRMISERLSNPRPVDSWLRRTQLDNLRNALQLNGALG